MKKKIIISIVTILLLIGIGSGIYFIFNKQDEKTSLTLLEKQWIEDNKNTMIDISVPSSLPIFNYEGEGVIDDFLLSLEESTGLSFNKVAYSHDDKIETSYGFVITNKKQKNDVLIYEDNDVLVTKENVRYNDLNKIPEMKIGILTDSSEEINYYLGVNKNLSFVTYDSAQELLEEYLDEKTSLNAIVIPKTIYMKEIIENDLYISYNITEMKNSLVIRLGDEKKLNTIFKKYYNKWKNDNYVTTFNNYFSNNYYAFSKIDDDDKVKFKSKQYSYGFVINKPYDVLVNKSLVGLNKEILKSFSELADIEIAFKQYNTKARLIEDFNANKVDFFFNDTSITKFDMDVYNTVSVFDDEIVILTSSTNNKNVNSIHSLKNEKVMAVSNSLIEKNLKDNNIEVKNYKNIETLLDKVNDKSVLALDMESYQIYKYNELKEFEIRYIYNLDGNYNYIIRDIKDNKVLTEYFNFYLSFINVSEITNEINYSVFLTENKINVLKNILFILVIILIVTLALLIVKIVKNSKKQKNGINKENKLKYIDMLTSLKNRNYLNDSIEKWDESGIYPQAIIIVDLNNIAYINDNYGHTEGDSVITEAANILIKNQLEQTEIMRTNGNEFLIYLVEYEEKQIVSYIRKLNKEFKELAHGFGAAIGYSMITDGLKTIDDAINEATLDMRTNKEEANNE